MMLCEMRAKIKECASAMQFAKEISIFDGIINTKAAWDQLPAETITNCFKSAGICDFQLDTPPPRLQQTWPPPRQMTLMSTFKNYCKFPGTNI